MLLAQHTIRKPAANGRGCCCQTWLRERVWMDVAVFASASVRAFGHLGSSRAFAVVLGGGSVAPPGRLGSVKVRVGARLHARRCEGVRFGPFSKKCPFPTTFHKTGDRLC